MGNRDQPQMRDGSMPVLVFQLGPAVYVLLLIWRTGFLAHRTSIAPPTILMVYVSCLLSLGGAIFLAATPTVRHEIKTISVCLAVATALTFAWLNLSGRAVHMSAF